MKAIYLPHRFWSLGGLTIGLLLLQVQPVQSGVASAQAQQPSRPKGSMSSEAAKVEGSEALEAELPGAKPVPPMQVVPLPYDQASFQYLGRELTRYHFGATLRRPFLYPVAGPEGRSLTRMGHPRDPFGHSHHNSVWISHANVDGVNFWADRGAPPLGQILCQRIEQYEDGDRSAWLIALHVWQNPQGKPLLLERRRIEVQLQDSQHWWILIDMQFQPPANHPVTLGPTPFGIIGVRMAKTISVADGGGRLLNSQGQQGEPAIFRKPARWVDYSGPILPLPSVSAANPPLGKPQASPTLSQAPNCPQSLPPTPSPAISAKYCGGITLMDHPANPPYPTPFHVRADGWMGASLTLAGPITIQPTKPLRLRYALWIHPGLPSKEQIEAQWQTFSKIPLPPLEPPKSR